MFGDLIHQKWSILQKIFDRLEELIAKQLASRKAMQEKISEKHKLGIDQPEQYIPYILVFKGGGGKNSNCHEFITK